MDYSKLIEKAIEARNNSYSPYSHFKVGACLITKSGKMFTGCNIENAAYGPSICAERTAIFKAVSEGERDIEAIAIIGSEANDYASPCGVCRQVMAEFNPEMTVILIKNKNDYKVMKLYELLPLYFGPKNLN